MTLRPSTSSGAQGERAHIPVLLGEVLAALAPQPGDVIVDATFGAGGYTRAILDAGATVHAFDRDPDAIAAGRAWPETQADPPRLVLHPRRFSEMVAALAEAGVARVDGVAMDIGVSSMQLDQAGRGFAFSIDGPLDMTMSQAGPTAADFLNEAPEAAIADVLYHYGEERQSRRVARAIVAARPLTTTGEALSSNVSSPSAPDRLYPQQRASPSTATPQVCSPPAARLENRPSPTDCGTARSSVEPFPSCP